MLPNVNEITPRDEAIIAHLIELGVLVEINTGRLDQDKGSIVLICSDPLRFPQIFLKHIEMQNGRFDMPFLFTLAMPGGALLLAPESKLLDVGSTLDHDLIKRIQMGVNEFDMATIALGVHVPCLGAHHAHMDAFAVTTGLFDAKQRVKTIFNARRKVAAFFQVHYSSGKMTYYFAKLLAWQAAYPTLAARWGAPSRVTAAF